MHGKPQKTAAVMARITVRSTRNRQNTLAPLEYKQGCRERIRGAPPASHNLSTGSGSERHHRLGSRPAGVCQLTDRRPVEKGGSSSGDLAESALVHGKRFGPGDIIRWRSLNSVGCGTGLKQGITAQEGRRDMAPGSLRSDIVKVMSANRERPLRTQEVH